MERLFVDKVKWTVSHLQAAVRRTGEWQGEERGGLAGSCVKSQHMWIQHQKKDIMTPITLIHKKAYLYFTPDT